MMAKIVIETENQMRDGSPEPRKHHMRLSIGETICEAMAHAADDLDLSAIAIFTETGATARQLSKYRPRPQIVGFTSIDVTLHRMGLLWGVRPLKCTRLYTTEQMVDAAEQLLQESGLARPREIVGIVAGTRTKSGSTNFLRLHVVGEPPEPPTRIKEVAQEAEEEKPTPKVRKPAPRRKVTANGRKATRSRR
jgi:pyruvate kinase